MGKRKECGHELPKSLEEKFKDMFGDCTTVPGKNLLSVEVAQIARDHSVEVFDRQWSKEDGNNSITLVKNLRQALKEQ